MTVRGLYCYVNGGMDDPAPIKDGGGFAQDSGLAGTHRARDDWKRTC